MHPLRLDLAAIPLLVLESLDPVVLGEDQLVRKSDRAINRGLRPWWPRQYATSRLRSARPGGRTVLNSGLERRRPTCLPRSRSRPRKPSRPGPAATAASRSEPSSLRSFGVSCWGRVGLAGLALGIELQTEFRVVDFQDDVPGHREVSTGRRHGIGRWVVDCRLDDRAVRVFEVLLERDSDPESISSVVVCGRPLPAIEIRPSGPPARRPCRVRRRARRGGFWPRPRNRSCRGPVPGPPVVGLRRPARSTRRRRSVRGCPSGIPRASLTTTPTRSPPERTPGGSPCAGRPRSSVGCRRGQSCGPPGQRRDVVHAA